jgi:hypothetical protein
MALDPSLARVLIAILAMEEDRIAGKRSFSAMACAAVVAQQSETSVKALRLLMEHSASFVRLRIGRSLKDFSLASQNLINWRKCADSTLFVDYALSRRSIEFLLEHTVPVYCELRRPRLGNHHADKYLPEQVILAYLLHLRSADSQRTLEVRTGMPEAQMSHLFPSAGDAIIIALSNHEETRIALPTVQRARALATALQRSLELPDEEMADNALIGVFAFVDGFLVKCHGSSGQKMWVRLANRKLDSQDVFFNQRMRMLCSNVVIIFDALGKIIWVRYGVAGRVHDVKVLQAIFRDPAFPPLRNDGRLFILGDRGFLGGDMQPFFKIPALRGDHAAYTSAHNRQIVARRQRVEWGVRSARAQFPILTSKQTHVRARADREQLCCFLLFNLRHFFDGRIQTLTDMIKNDAVRARPGGGYSLPTDPDFSIRVPRQHPQPHLGNADLRFDDVEPPARREDYVIDEESVNLW